MRTASAWLVVFWIAVCPAWAQGGDTAADVSKGHHLAVTVCAICHVAAADQETPPIMHPPAPPFESIAQRKDISADTLQKFLTTTHRELGTQKGMPYPDLADFQVKQVVAYLLSLRK
jgi:mono/diheme cytochrome c family protein